MVCYTLGGQGASLQIPLRIFSFENSGGDYQRAQRTQVLKARTLVFVLSSPCDEKILGVILMGNLAPRTIDAHARLGYTIDEGIVWSLCPRQGPGRARASRQKAP